MILHSDLYRWVKSELVGLVYLVGKGVGIGGVGSVGTGAGGGWSRSGVEYGWEWVIGEFLGWNNGAPQAMEKTMEQVWDT